ncbi:hypothetical protein LR948_16425 [Roseivivax sp. GX 12232]|uniref:hypothetical protein n=1 Tax=Roseivivax sp. GX 12232 TaxID=2900547 RepID=UPI001E5D21A7|nr:hypothetical protein [Roseivivax sp. GX 12232]MCE0506957.1 hypothetical protein [Roseivivax sp. GX 12232]
MTSSPQFPQAHAHPAQVHDGNEHPMIDLPFSVLIDGRHHKGEALSLVEARISGLVDPALDGAERVVRLGFDFPGFQVVLTPTARITLQDDASAALVFTDPTGEHQAQLRQILNDYISGDLTSAGALIRSGALTQPRGPKAPPPARGFGDRLGSALAGLAVAVFSLALIGLILTLMQERIFTTSIDTPGRVLPSGQAMRATADGQIAFLNPEAAQGEVLYSIDTSDGETLSFAKPCDCAARPLNIAEGSTVLAGEPLIALRRAEGGMVVEADIPSALLFDIQRSGAVEVELANGLSFEARPEGAPRIAPGTMAEDHVHATFTPETDLPESAMGQVAALSVSHDALAPLAPLQDLGARALSGAAALWTGASDGAEALLAGTADTPSAAADEPQGDIQ